MQRGGNMQKGKTNALQQIKCVCYAHVCASLPSPPPHLLQPPLPAPPLSLSLTPYSRLVRPLKIDSGRLLSLLRSRWRYLRRTRETEGGTSTAGDSRVSMAACTCHPASG